jgi:DNA-binding response OmpR family regulator
MAPRIMDKPGKPAGSFSVTQLGGGTQTDNYEAPLKDLSGQTISLSHDPSNERHIPKIFVVCDQKDTAPVWGYILRQQGLQVILETSLEKAIDHWSEEIIDLIVLDIHRSHSDRVLLYKTFREQSVVPLLLLLPAYDETQILDAYAAGVDDVVVKPISPAIFLEKIMAWVRHSWIRPVDGLHLVKAGEYRLEPARRCMIDPHETEIGLTNLEFRLLYLLMSRPGHIFGADEIVESMWGGYGDRDQVLLKNVIYRLRKKIEADPGHPLLLQTWRGGYSFQG